VILQSQSFLMTLFELRLVGSIREGIIMKSGKGINEIGREKEYSGSLCG